MTLSQDHHNLLGFPLGGREVPIDIVILSNGPGEVTTWVKPVVQALRERLGDDRDRLRISVMLSPCPHAMGNEAQVVRRYPEVDRVQESQAFFPFLLQGKTAENWNWRSRGVVLFLGGDQFYTLAVGKRLGYRTVIYAEWEARWYRWINAFGVMNEKVLTKIPAPYHEKMTVIGDLMADGSRPPQKDPETEIVGMLPGSKPSKLTQGVPLCLAIASEIHCQRPQTRFELALAPTLTPESLAQYADPETNPLVNKMGGITAQLTQIGDELALVTPQGLTVYLITDFPARDRLSQFRLALTTVGANTAELGALAVPMIILLPTQHLEAMRTWDGLPGLLARLPGVGRYFARLINYGILSQKRLFAWPNLWAGREIVPELVGALDPQQVAHQVVDLLTNPDRLQQMRHDLQQVRGQPGAARAIAELVAQQVSTAPVTASPQD